jgi:hypothetical protein
MTLSVKNNLRGSGEEWETERGGSSKSVTLFNMVHGGDGINCGGMSGLN